jgi:hypothetical protein
MSEGDHIWMVQFLHNLQFPVLITFVLVYLFDCHLLITVSVDRGLEYHSETTIANNSISIVGELLLLFLFVLTGSVIVHWFHFQIFYLNSIILCI